MIRQTWLAHAKAPLARQPRARFLSHTSISLSPKFNRTAKDGPNEFKISGVKTPKSNPNDEFGQWRTSRLKTGFLLPSEEKSRKAIAKRFSKNKTTQGHMLVVEGLNTNLQASDFTRLAARDLSDWQSAINEVHQERDPWTLDPLGTYRISFSSQAASTVYRSKLDRLYRLAQHKLRSPTGLWVNTLPDHLRSTDLTPEEEADLFTIVPGTLADGLSIQTSRVKGEWPWQRLMDKLIRRSGFAVEPAAVLVHSHSSPLSTSELQAFIHADAEARDEPWAIAQPFPLTLTLNEKGTHYASGGTRVPLLGDKAFLWKLRCRHVLVCKSPDVAWRFIRSWNQRTIERDREGKTLKSVITASYIEV